MFKRLFAKQAKDELVAPPPTPSTWLVSLNLPPVPVRPQRSLRIGRKASCDFVINDKKVSRTHAEVFHKNGCVWVRDLGSHNGTVVDGVRIEGISPLRVGSKLELHDYVFLVSETPTEFPEHLSTHYGATTYTQGGECARASFRGSLQDLDLGTILQTLETMGQTGILKVSTPTTTGRLGVRSGQPIWARHGDLEGEMAMVALLHLQRGDYEFATDHPGIEREISPSLTELLLGAAAQA